MSTYFVTKTNVSLIMRTTIFRKLNFMLLFFLFLEMQKVRVVGVFAHISAVFWYLGYARFMNKIVEDRKCVQDYRGSDNSPLLIVFN